MRSPAAPSNSSLHTCTHSGGGIVTIDGALSAPQASDAATASGHAKHSKDELLLFSFATEKSARTNVSKVLFWECNNNAKTPRPERALVLSGTTAFPPDVWAP